MRSYANDTSLKFTEPSINAFYFRVLTSIMIIEELEFDNILIEADDENELPNYDS